MPRRLGPAKEAREIVGVTPGTLRNWLRQNLISAVRVGPRGRFLYDLASIEAMKIEYGKTIDQHISELVDAAEELTPEEITKIRLLLHAGPAGGDAP